MFTLQHEWLQSVYEYLLKGVMPKRCTTSQIWYLAQRHKHLCFKKEYYTNLDKIKDFIEYYN
jgi:hypothetical protein